MKQRSKTFQDFSNYDALKLQAWYGTKDLESTLAFHLVDEMKKYSVVKSYRQKRIEIQTHIEEEKNRSTTFAKALGDAMASTEPRPVHSLVYWTLECFDEIRNEAPAEPHPTKGDLRKAVEKKLGRSVTAKQWERTLVDCRLWMLSENKPGRPSIK